MNKKTDFEEHVMDYWRISRVWHGRSCEPITTEGAIAVTNYLLSRLNPARPLWVLVANIQYGVIEHGSKPRMKEPSLVATILQMLPRVSNPSELIGETITINVKEQSSK